MREAHGSRAAVAAAAVVLFTVACGSGDGPVGVAAIGTRESPSASADDPHGSVSAGGGTGSGSSPSPSPTSTSTSPPATDGGPGPGPGPGSNNLAQSCTGSFNCDGAAITLAMSGGKCMFTVNDQPVIMNADNTLVLPNGQAAGTWSGGATGFTVTGGPQNRVTTCTPSAPDGGK